ncbi:MAG: hypothetical protein AB4058_11840 [Microcystaceae cyanobacterium]
MAKATDADIQVLKDLIGQRFDQLQQENVQMSQQMGQISQQMGEMSQQMDKMSQQIHNLEIGQAKMEARMEEWKRAIDTIPNLAEKVGELKNWRQIALIIITATFGGFIGWFIPYRES